MAQTTDWDLDAAIGGLAQRVQLNAMLAALLSSNSGSTAPSPTVAGMLWLDTGVSPVVLRRRNNANSGWVAVNPETVAANTLWGNATGSAAAAGSVDLTGLLSILNTSIVPGNPFRWISPGAVGSRLMIALGTASTTTSGVTVTFPLAFSSTPYIQVTAIASVTPLFCTYQSASASTFVAQTWDAAGTQTAGSVSWLAIGSV